MKVIIVLSALCALALAAPQGGGGDADATIVKFDSENGIEGYNFLYETSNGIAAEESGSLQNAGSENEAIAAKGSYSYTAPNGKTVSVTYEADEGGFRPKVTISKK